MSAPCAWAARNMLRPMRPNPLIPTRKDMASQPIHRLPADDFDPQAVGVEQVGGVVARAVLRAAGPGGPSERPPAASPAS